jgi:DNA-binding NtrC family response regulator
MHTRKRTTGSQQVLIVSANPETLDGLQAYLRSAGVAARGSRRLEDCAAVAMPPTVAVVLFPDDFPLEAVVTALSGIAAGRARILRVVVTGKPKTFEHLVESRGDLLIVARPVWGWSILDAIRAHVDDDAPKRAAMGAA